MIPEATTTESKRELNAQESAKLEFDYAAILESYKLDYILDNLYYQVGELNTVQGWIIHVSSIKSQIHELLISLVPVLVINKVTFKIIKDAEAAQSILNGVLGTSQIGKIVKIYPESDIQATSIVTALKPITSHLKGPMIPTDANLGGNIYVRYGGHNPVVQINQVGRKDRLIYEPTGQLIVDSYKIPFEKLPWVTWPFDPIKSQGSRNNQTLLNGRFKTNGETKGRPQRRCI